MSVLEPRVTSSERLVFPIFSNPSYFCMWNFVSGDKAQLALSHETKLHIQKFKSAILAEIQRYKFAELDIYNDTVNAYEYTAVLNLVHTGIVVRIQKA